MEPSVVLHVTAVLLEPVTVAVNCSVPPEETVALVGDIEIAAVPAAARLTVDEAEMAVLAGLVDLTVTVAHSR